jgi:16S rRNA (cytosine1402-N4)-methyltransferase
MRHNLEDALDPDYVHISVLWREILDFISDSEPAGKGSLVDATVGEGGHSRLILENFPDIEVIGFERDPEIMERAEKRLADFGSRVKLFNRNFSAIEEVLGERAEDISYFLFDFGISSYHIDTSGRGFTFSREESLDMRLDHNKGNSAAYIVNNYTEKQLADIIYKYGEERWSRKIAAYICRARKEKPIEKTDALSKIVLSAIPRRFHVKNIHPATRVFQALRIEVNRELEAIEEGLSSACSLLRKGGLIMAISFHSLEDRIAKKRFRQFARGCTCGNEPGQCLCTGKPYARILTKKPVQPQQDEIDFNNRSRSAKLRVCEKL